MRNIKKRTHPRTLLTRNVRSKVANCQKVWMMCSAFELINPCTHKYMGSIPPFRTHETVVFRTLEAYLKLCFWAQGPA